jgi:hypothetical protein
VYYQIRTNHLKISTVIVVRVDPKKLELIFNNYRNMQVPFTSILASIELFNQIGFTNVLYECTNINNIAVFKTLIRKTQKYT